LDERTPAWGIEPVPERLRVLGALDTTLLWGNLGVSLLVLVLAAFLVPSLSLPQAVVAIVAGVAIGCTMLALAGMIGADARVPAMVLLRAPLGRRGSYVPTALNVLQGLGWATFELIVIAAAAAALSDELFGFRATSFWTVVFGGVAAAMALAGPISVVRRFIRKVALWAVPASLVYLTVWALTREDVGVLWGQPGQGGSIWLGIDLVVAITVSWIPLAADYTRFSRDRRAALVGTGVGYAIGSAWMLLLGVILVLARDLSDPVALPIAVAAAGLAAALALLAVTVDETDEAFANVYSTAVSIQNVAPELPQRLLIGGVATLATIGALAIDIRNYETYLLLLGSVFVPLFGVLMADWLLAGRRYDRDRVFGAPALRTGPLVAWVAGFALYHWLHQPPLGPDWWVDLVERTDPPELGVGATLPSFAFAFLLTMLLGAVARRAPAAARADA
jgi:NCS1 family nucleobase:cation symporter-1